MPESLFNEKRIRNFTIVNIILIFIYFSEPDFSSFHPLLNINNYNNKKNAIVLLIFGYFYFLIRFLILFFENGKNIFMTTYKSLWGLHHGRYLQKHTYSHLNDNKNLNINPTKTYTFFANYYHTIKSGVLIPNEISYSFFYNGKYRPDEIKDFAKNKSMRFFPDKSKDDTTSTSVPLKGMLKFKYCYYTFFLIFKTSFCNSATFDYTFPTILFFINLCWSPYIINLFF
ncbi:MAG: hypothetical protein OEZ22_15040 [Spirochaetia bacterium]|nr:hypothetical protein [Spirochaetia bacterium]